MADAERIPTACVGCPVRAFGVCRAMDDQDIRLLRQIEILRRVPAGTTIMREGEAPDYFGSIASGVIKLTKRLLDGRLQIVGFLFLCDFVGRPFAAASPYTAEAVSDVVLQSYRRGQFEDLLRRLPQLEHNLHSLMLSELDAAHEWMLLLGQKTAREKVASLLLLFARRIGEHRAQRPDRGQTFPMPLSRADMADCLGLRLETVSRQISRLRSEGIIRECPGHIIEVAELARLRAAAEMQFD